MTATQTDTNGFEIKTCGRCGGSGRYSYCTMYGDTCFQCSGAGKTYTAKGDRQRKRFEELCTVRAEELKVGDTVRISGRFSVIVDIHENGGSKWLDKETGLWIPYFCIETKHGGINTFRNAPIRKGQSKADKAAKIAQAIAETK